MEHFDSICFKESLILDIRSTSCVFGSFGYAKRSLYDHDLSLLLVLSSLVLSLASVSVDSSAINFQNGCL